MKYLRAVGDAILDRSVEELIGALLLATAVAAVMGGVYALRSRKSSATPNFVGVLVLATAALCMPLTAGYMEYLTTGGQSPSPLHFPGPAMRPPPEAGQAKPRPPWEPPPFNGGWSAGTHIMVAADENRDGRLTADEVAALVRQADTDGDGAVNFQDLDRLLAHRFRAQVHPPGHPRSESLVHERGNVPPDTKLSGLPHDDESSSNADR